MFLTNAQILGHINIGIRQPLSPTRLGLVMKQEGYEAVRSGGRRGYRVVELKGMKSTATNAPWRAMWGLILSWFS